jgi:colanic acid/amylovoran biosynthesis glycosyltransferase
MNIAYFTSMYARASDTFIRNEVLELRRRGHQVSTYSIRREAKDARVGDEVRSEQAGTHYILEQPKWRLLAAFAARVARHPARVIEVFRLASQTRAHGLRSLLMHCAYIVEAAYLAKRLQATGVQILHNHIAENSATIAMYSSMLSGIPFSMTVHGPGIFFQPRLWALGEKVRRSAFTACITHFCKSQCMLFAPEEAWSRLHVVRCAVGKSFESAAMTPVPAAPRLVFVGRLCAEKGLPLLVEAVTRQVAAGKPCELVLVGDGPMRGEVERVIEQRSLHNAIRILGWKNSDEVRAEIENSRTLVLPSFAEGLPVVIMEALALGRTVISTRIAGIPELVEEGINGWLVSAGSVDELVVAIDHATSASTQALTAMGEAGSARVRQLHRLGTEVDRLESLMKGAVDSTRAA